MKLTVLLAGALLAAPQPGLAQSPDLLSGSWSGDIGLSMTGRSPVKLDLKFDGTSNVSGTATGPGPLLIKAGSFDPTTGALRLELEITRGNGVVPFLFEGVAVDGVATGKVTDGTRTGSFRIARAGAGGPASTAEAAVALRKSFSEVSGWVSKAAALVPADKYAFQPTKEVRSFGRVIAHLADSYNYYCAVAAGKNVQWTDPVEKGKLDKATLVPALQQALDRCVAAYVVGDAAPPTENVAHTSLHYGNLITYLRLLGMVPPSS